MVTINPINVATLLFEEYKKEYFPPTQVTNRKIYLKERIWIIIIEYNEVEIAEDIVLANNEYDSNVY